MREHNNGKLVWKVDWPMRWAYEGVTFEAAGVDHSSPGSSFTVGSQLVRQVFAGQPPHYLVYSFVGTRGAAKMSSSAGGAPAPAEALRILEAPILRWLYTRRRPSQSITVDFGPEVPRLYDEWDRLKARVASGAAEPWEASVLDRATRTSKGKLLEPHRPVPFRVLASVIDITAGDRAQIERILRTMDSSTARMSLDEVEPRLGLARDWVTECLPAGDRTHVRTEPHQQMLAGLADADRQALRLLTDRLDQDWTLEGLTHLVYAIPKLRHGLANETLPPQRSSATRKSSSDCSIGYSSTPTAAHASPPCCCPSAKYSSRTLLIFGVAA